MNNVIKSSSSKILSEIEKAQHILLHCHPYPDPDSVGSVLAMMHVLKRLGKDVVAIIGDTSYPENLSKLPDHDWITNKKISDIDLKNFDLFIILDSSSLAQVSQASEVNIPESLKTIVIDHHKTNQQFGNLNLVVPETSSTSQILYYLFGLWNIDISPEIALYLLLGIYADTGGFKYPNSDSETLNVASKLAAIYPEYHKFVFDLVNYKKPVEIEMMGLALSTIEKHCSGKFVTTSVSNKILSENNIAHEDAIEGLIPDTLRSVIGWLVVASLVEVEPEKVIVSLRTRDETRYDVSKIASILGKNGGGHRGAAGTTILKPIDAAKKELIEAVEKTFPDLSRDSSAN